MLLRIDMPGLSFEELDLRFDARASVLSYRPESLDELIAWNGIELCEDEMVAPSALRELLILCYAHWRALGGTGTGAMEAVLASDAPIRLDPRQPLRQPLFQRLSVAMQAWLGLLDIHDDFEAV